MPDINDWKFDEANPDPRAPAAVDTDARVDALEKRLTALEVYVKEQVAALAQSAGGPRTF